MYRKYRRLSASFNFLLILTFLVFIQNKSLNLNNRTLPHAAIVTLIRSTNQSIQLTMNMMNSIMRFYFQYQSVSYPFLIFHDENFTLSMREHINSSLTIIYPNIRILFASVNFQTSIQPNPSSYIEKPMSYRLMCRFWIHDVFYHPIIIQNQYDYLMRMDDDSSLFDSISDDLFEYMKRTRLDYFYRGKYKETDQTMNSIVPPEYRTDICIYNNFFIIRLNWYYQSRIIRNLVENLLKNETILREYIGDGCIHQVMIDIDTNSRSEQTKQIPYGHNYHIMPIGADFYYFIKDDEIFSNLSFICKQKI